MKLLKRGHSVVAKAASTDETRYVINSVLIEETEIGLRTVGTDGRMLAMVEDTAPGLTAEDFPANVIPATAPNGAKSAIVPTEAFVSAYKSLPKKNHHMPVLLTVAVVMGKTDTTFGTTDLESPTVKTAKNIEGHFPDYRLVIPKENTANFTCSYSPVLLGRALRIASEFGLEQVKMEFTGSLNPVKITGERDGQALTIVVMPMNPGGK